MANENAVTVRVSSHDFTDRQIDETTLREIIEEAQLAPSWMNSQPWKAYVACGETLRAIKAAHKASVESGEKSWTEVVPPQEWAAYPQANIDAWNADLAATIGQEGLDEFMASEGGMFNSQAIVYVTVPKDATLYSAYDAGAFGYGVLLAATERGIGSIPAYEFIRFPKEVRAAFDIPEDEALLMGVGLGYPSDSVVNEMRSKRNGMDVVLQLKG